MKTKHLLIAFPALPLIWASGCTDPDTAALLRSQHHQPVVVKPSTSDPAAQKMYDEYMKTHKDAPGAMPGNDSLPPPSK